MSGTCHVSFIEETYTPQQGAVARQVNYDLARPPMPTRVGTRERAHCDVPHHAPRNIAALHGILNGAGAEDNFILSGAMLRQLVGEQKVSIPPPATLKPRPAPSLPAPIWIRPREAVAQYGIRTTLLYKLINEQRVNSKLIGGARVISVASLDALADAEPQARRRGRPRRNADAAE
jgi:hypothetical protein